MSKKNDKQNDKKLNKIIGKAIDRNYEEAKDEASNFYDDTNGLVNIFEQGPVTKIVANILKTPDSQTLMADQMQERCLKIREKVQSGKPNNIEIDFVHGVQKFEGRKVTLGDTVLKAVEYSSHTPIYLYRKKDDATDALVFIGGDYAEAFLITKDNDGNTTFIKLAELHMLSISEDSTPEEEIGLMTSYIWLTAKIYSSPILAVNLDPVKNLLMAEAIYAKAFENRIRVEEENADGKEEKNADE